MAAKYKVLKSFCLGNGIDTAVGDVINVPSPLMTPARAKAKAATGWLELVPELEEEAPEEEEATEELELTGGDHPTEGELEDNAPPPPRRGRSAKGK